MSKKHSDDIRLKNNDQGKQGLSVAALKIWMPLCLPHYYDLPLTRQLDASSWMLIFFFLGRGGGGRLSPHASHIPRVLIRGVWDAWMIGLRCCGWTCQVWAEADRQTGGWTERDFEAPTLLLEECVGRYHVTSSSPG